MTTNKILSVIENVYFVSFVEERINPLDVMTEKQHDDFKFVINLMNKEDHEIQTSEWNELIRQVIYIDDGLTKLANKNSKVDVPVLRAVK